MWFFRKWYYYVIFECYLFGRGIKNKVLGCRRVIVNFRNKNYIEYYLRVFIKLKYF